MTRLIQDINPAKYLVTAYEPGRMKINEQWYQTSMALHAAHIHPIEANQLEQLSLDTLKPILAWKPDILLLGTGPNHKIPPQTLLAHLLSLRIGVEFMDSMAACRTFHVLTSEQRQVAAVILIA